MDRVAGAERPAGATFMINLPLAFFENIGLTELIIILLIVLLLFGHRLPGLGRSLGRSVSEFKEGLKEGDAQEDKNQAGAPKQTKDKPSA
jgi:TatA/E family protein of Tat protein translocase